MSKSSVRIDVADPDSADAQLCLSKYFDELRLRFEDGFDPAKSAAPTLDDFRPPSGIFLVVRVDGRPVGCGGFKPFRQSAYLKRMWIDEAARGLGLGRRLLHTLEEHAKATGYKLVRLETDASLTEAQQLYRQGGYVEVEPFNDERYAHHWFEKPL